MRLKGSKPSWRDLRRHCIARRSKRGSPREPIGWRPARPIMTLGRSWRSSVRAAMSQALPRLDREIETISQEIDTLNVAIAEHDARTGRETLRERCRNAGRDAKRAE